MSVARTSWREGGNALIPKEDGLDDGARGWDRLTEGGGGPNLDKIWSWGTRLLVQGACEQSPERERQRRRKRESHTGTDTVVLALVLVQVLVLS